MTDRTERKAFVERQRAAHLNALNRQSDQFPCAGTEPPDGQDRMRHFHALDHAQQLQAIHRLASAGMSDHGIAQATGLSVEFVRRLLGEVIA